VTPYRSIAQPEPLPRIELTGDVLQVSDANLGECKRALQAILANMKKLRDYANRHPVFVQFAGYHFCLVGEQHVEELVVALECKLAEYGYSSNAKNLHTSSATNSSGQSSTGTRRISTILVANKSGNQGVSGSDCVRSPAQLPHGAGSRIAGSESSE
jgi:hypothetical protein